MAFGQICKVLEMEPLPSSKQPQKFPWADKEGGRFVLIRGLKECGRLYLLLRRLVVAARQVEAARQRVCS